MKKLLALALAVVLALSVFAGCAAGGKKAELALITDIGTIDDKSFNQGAWEGLVKYAEEKGISHQYYQPTEKSTTAYLESIDQAVKNGAKVIVTPGFLFEEPVTQAAATYPDVSFVAIDCTLPEAPANAVGVTYAEEQVGFLAGYAAVKEGYTKLGFLGGMPVPAVVKYGYGFVQGADAAAKELGVKPLATWVAGALAGVEPEVMGLGPIAATKKVMAKTGLTVADMDLVEANEAFAAQSIAVGEALGFDKDKLNVNGGAIALGHPVGASGARILVTLLYAMKHRGAHKGLATLCIGGGMGCATIVEMD